MTTDNVVDLNGPTVPPASGKVAKQLVVFLHGLGADGHDLISLAPAFQEVLPDAQCISPHAPFQCDMAPFGFQWFSLQDRAPEAMLQGIKKAAPILNSYIDAQLQSLGLTDQDLILIGFSQGTMMSLYTALRRPKACRAVIGYSGALIGEESLDSELRSSPPVCLIHGEADMVVPCEASVAAHQVLKERGLEVEFHRRPMLQHGIDPEGVHIAKAFIQAHS